MRRSHLARRVEMLAGNDTIRIADAAKGWPATAEVFTPRGVIPIALHVGPIGLSHRNRDDVERRFQNPSGDKPVQEIRGLLSVLLGVWEQETTPIFVGMDATTRQGRATRQSLFVPLHVLKAALSAGWVEHFSTSGEKIVAFSPELLPIYVEMRAAGVEVDPEIIKSVLAAAGIGRDNSTSPLERGRRTASQLIRDAQFSRTVRESYGGLCALCGIDYCLVVGAHIYPASAPTSPDEVWNGIALCQNHHAAFDAHQLFIHPRSYAVILHPTLKEGASLSAACGAFVQTTFPRLQLPKNAKDHPRAVMLEKRYQFYDPRYGWINT